MHSIIQTHLASWFLNLQDNSGRLDHADLRLLAADLEQKAAAKRETLALLEFKSRATSELENYLPQLPQLG